MTLTAATEWMARGAALAAAIAALELLCVRRALADTGVFAWPVLRRDFAAAPAWLRAVADRVMSYRGIVVVLIVQLASAAALPWLSHPAVPWLAFACSLVVSIRFGGLYNGGSDAMLLVVLLALGVVRSAPDSELAAAGLAYAAVQLVLSYWISGIAKLPDAAWRSGRALPILLRLPHYRVPAWVHAVAGRSPLARLAGWAILGFECAFPLALISPSVCLGLLGCGAAFHVANAVVFGLNRFLWTWLAVYPALIYWVDRVHR